MTDIDTKLEALETRRQALLKAKNMEEAIAWLTTYGPRLSKSNTSLDIETKIGDDIAGKSVALRLLASVIISQGAKLLPLALTEANSIITAASQD